MDEKRCTQISDKIARRKRAVGRPSHRREKILNSVLRK
jgi:hypothetical protein